MPEWICLSDVAKAADVPESSARRYARLAESYLPKRAAGRIVLFDKVVAVPIMRRIGTLFRRGYRAADVELALAQEFERPDEPLVDALVEENHEPRLAPVAAVAAAMAEMMAACNALRAELTEERAARLALESKLAVLESELVAGKRRAREFEAAVERKLKR